MKNWLSFLMVFGWFSLNLAQQKDTLKTENKPLEFQHKNLYIPAGLMIAGALCEGKQQSSIKNQVAKIRNQNFSGFHNRIDDYAQFTPFIALYGFEWLGMEPKTDWINRTAILAKGQAINLGTLYLLKFTMNKPRPDGTPHSFPSGHTANAFAGATILAIEYGENHKWVPYAAYGVATGVGIMRIANNRHYISDVLFGAGLGILSMKLAYWLHQYKWNQKKDKQADPFKDVMY